MLNRLMSVRGLNLLVNVGLGINVFVLGVLRIVDPGGLWFAAAASTMLMLGLFAMWANSSAYHEQMDEMASYHDGWATTVSYHVAFMLVGIGCVLSLVRGFEVDLGAGCLMLMGIAMVAHGVTFAVLEKEEVYADYQDA